MSRNKAYGQLWENIWPVEHNRLKWNKMYPGVKIYELGSEAEVIWGSMCLESQERLWVNMNAFCIYVKRDNTNVLILKLFCSHGNKVTILCKFIHYNEKAGIVNYLHVELKQLLRFSTSLVFSLLTFFASGGSVDKCWFLKLSCCFLASVSYLCSISCSLVSSFSTSSSDWLFSCIKASCSSANSCINECKSDSQ